MGGASVTFKNPRFDSLKLETSNSYPRKKQLILKAHYEKINVSSSRYSPDLSIPVTFYLLQSDGYIEFSNPYNN